MTIEEKAKAYDEALEIAKGLYAKDAPDSLHLERMFPALAESEDEKIRKGLIDYFENLASNKDYCVDKNRTLSVSSIISYLEKQGEQKPLIIPKFRVGDIITPNGKKEYYTITDIVDGWYKFKEKHVNGGIPTHYQFGWELVEQKPAIEILKIEEGKWYICISQFCNCIEGRVYKATSDNRIIDDFGTEYDMHSDAFKYFRLWTIQDAKDGDVLACESGWTCIFRALDNHTNTFSSYCFMDSDKWFCNTGCTCHTLDEQFIRAYNFKLHPATKEQRDLLFQKMKEAGYEWDADKKELKKIEQKPAEWSEEDEAMLKNIKEILTKQGFHQIQANWLNSLKDRVQPKQEWNEEDEKMINSIAVHLNATTCGFPEDRTWADRFMNWLKSLKDRVQSKNEWSEEDKKIQSWIIEYVNNLPLLYAEIKIDGEDISTKEYRDKVISWLKSLHPKNTWKPSEKHMKWLHDAIESTQYEPRKQALISLYSDLMKLSE